MCEQEQRKRSPAVEPATMAALMLGGTARNCAIGNYWTELAFEAYVDHRSDVIFLKGLPDMAESRPHSRVNR